MVFYILIYTVLAAILYKEGFTSPKVYSILAIFILLIFPFIWSYLRKKLKRYHYLISPMRKVDRMDGTQFEEYLQANLENLGYHVKHIGKTGDFGGDLILSRYGKKTILQAKRYNSNVGVKAVQEAISAREYYRCKNAVVATNSHFTKAAKEMAAKCNVELWDREHLQKKFR